jgi:hypothetical protein
MPPALTSDGFNPALASLPLTGCPTHHKRSAGNKGCLNLMFDTDQVNTRAVLT